MSSTPTPQADTPEVAPPVSSVASSVRRNAVWAAGAAVIMLWYGLRDWDMTSATTGQRIFVYTLRVGGGLMVLSALLSLTGLRPALLFDAAASVLIGVALLITAALMYSDDGTQALLNALFGAVFIHSGYRNWEDFRTTAAPEPAAAPPSHDRGI